MNRKDLDAFVAHHQVPAATVDTILDISGARPTAGELRQFVVRLLQLAGALSLAAGIVFFVAANWQELGVTGRFALVQGVIVVCVALALWRPAPQSPGRYSLLLAFIATGALLALFGQTYQTGADVYELFLTWAVLGSLLVVAGQWSVLGAAWLMVLNVALLLFSRGRWDESAQLLVPTVLNMALWALVEYGRRTRWTALAPRWLSRLALACAFGFMTWAGVAAVARHTMSAEHAFTIAVVLILQAGLVLHAMRSHNDVFPLALTAGSLIVISACALGTYAGFDDTGMLLVQALWLIASSAISGRVLMSLVRAWRHEEDAA